jgi:hypothetical protein
MREMTKSGAPDSGGVWVAVMVTLLSGLKEGVLNQKTFTGNGLRSDPESGVKLKARLVISYLRRATNAILDMIFDYLSQIFPEGARWSPGDFLLGNGAGRRTFSGSTLA